MFSLTLRRLYHQAQKPVRVLLPDAGTDKYRNLSPWFQIKSRSSYYNSTVAFLSKLICILLYVCVCVCVQVIFRAILMTLIKHHCHSLMKIYLQFLIVMKVLCGAVGGVTWLLAILMQSAITEIYRRDISFEVP